MNRTAQQILKIAGILYVLLLIYLLFFAFFRKGTSTNINFIPFKTIIEFFRDFHWPHWWYWMMNIPGNIIAFIPLPFIIKTIFNVKNAHSTKLFVLYVSPLIIELIQGVFEVGSPNIDDVILNCLGLYIGFKILPKLQQST